MLVSCCEPSPPSPAPRFAWRPAAARSTRHKGRRPSAAASTRLRWRGSTLTSPPYLPTKNRLDGNAAINKATDKFLLDVNTAKIDNKRRNRMIDLAMGSLANQCEQCFQALEAGRPIPGLRYGETGCGA